MIYIESKCIKEFGCIIRYKFLTYVTPLDKNGNVVKGKPTINHKVMYVFKDKLVFYTSKEPGDKGLEEEDDSLTIPQEEANVERNVYFGQIILDCGKFHNKLCHAEEYHHFNKINEVFKEISKRVLNNPQVNCLVIPFFENGYKQIHEKVAIVCSMDNNELYKLIEIKNSLSRTIEGFQLSAAKDRYSSFNGLLKRKLKMITYHEGKALPVTARLKGKSLHLQKNKPDDKAFFKEYSFFEQKAFGSFALQTSVALARNKIPDNWQNGLTPGPQPDCCIFFKGQTEDLLICIASAKTGQELEGAGDICTHRIKELLHDINDDIAKIRLTESFETLTMDPRKLNDCKSKEWKIFRERLKASAVFGIKTCKMVHTFVTDSTPNKYDYCFKNYSHQLKYETKMISFEDDGFEKALEECVNKQKEISKLYDEKTFQRALKKNKIFTSMLDKNNLK